MFEIYRKKRKSPGDHMIIIGLDLQQFDVSSLPESNEPFNRVSVSEWQHHARRPGRLQQGSRPGRIARQGWYCVSKTVPLPEEYL